MVIGLPSESTVVLSGFVPEPYMSPTLTTCTGSPDVVVLKANPNAGIVDKLSDFAFLTSVLAPDAPEI